ncbi:MAG: MFS transporter [Schaedlerella sp.]
MATMMFVARIFDGTSDLIMGALIDKTKSRYGNSRHYFQ